jgi:putative hydrolase of the HAD superfamily
MSNQTSIKGLLVDVGGVLLSNSWDEQMRENAARVFKYDFDEANSRHHDALDSFERGLLSLDEYLSYTIFHKDRPFSKEQFKEHMLTQSRALPRMREYLAALKEACGICVVIVSNDVREFTEYRINKFSLKNCADIFVCSCFVGVRKPSAQIYKIALDVSHLQPQEVLYIEDRRSFVQAASLLHIAGIQHTNYENTKKFLEEHGLAIENRQEHRV